MSRVLKAVSFSSSGIFLNSEIHEHSELLPCTSGDMFTFGTVREGLAADHTLLLVLDYLDPLGVESLLKLGEVDVYLGLSTRSSSPMNAALTLPGGKSSGEVLFRSGHDGMQNPGSEIFHVY